MRAVHRRAEGRGLWTRIARILRRHASALVAMAVLWSLLAGCHERRRDPLSPSPGSFHPALSPLYAFGGLLAFMIRESLETEPDPDPPPDICARCRSLAAMWGTLAPHTRIERFEAYDHKVHLCVQLIWNHRHVPPEQREAVWLLIPAWCLDKWHSEVEQNDPGSPLGRQLERAAAAARAREVPAREELRRVRVRRQREQARRRRDLRAMSQEMGAPECEALLLEWHQASRPVRKTKLYDEMPARCRELISRGAGAAKP